MLIGKGEGAKLCGLPLALTSVSVHLKGPWTSVHRQRQRGGACLGGVLCRQPAAVGSAGA